ncbi:MAG: hypothetical protein WCF36_19105 [Candidatus Nanopelagicales bacterium]
MQTQRALVAVLGMALLSGILVAPPASAQGAPASGGEGGISALSVGPLGAEDIDPADGARATVAVGGTRELRWADTPVDPDLSANVFEIDIMHVPALLGVPARAGDHHVGRAPRSGSSPTRSGSPAPGTPAAGRPSP